jgi:hypothetical protein
MLKKTILLFAITSLLVLILMLMKASFIHEKVWFIQVFFFCVFLIGAKINKIGISRPTNQIHLFYFLTMSVRFILSIAFFSYNVVHTTSGILTFMFNFVFLYLFYTAFEIYLLIHNLRSEFKNTNANNL